MQKCAYAQAAIGTCKALRKVNLTSSAIHTSNCFRYHSEVLLTVHLTRPGQLVCIAQPSALSHAGMQTARPGYPGYERELVHGQVAVPTMSLNVSSALCLVKHTELSLEHVSSNDSTPLISYHAKQPSWSGYSSMKTSPQLTQATRKQGHDPLGRAGMHLAAHRARHHPRLPDPPHRDAGP